MSNLNYFNWTYSSEIFFSAEFDKKILRYDWNVTLCMEDLSLEKLAAAADKILEVNKPTE